MSLRSRPAVLLASVLLVLSLAACGDSDDGAGDSTSTTPSASSSAPDDMLKKLTDGSLGAVVGQGMVKPLAAAGIELDGAATCTSDLEPNVGAGAAEGTVRCQGKTTGGKKVVANYTGTLKPDADQGCKGKLVIKVSNVKKVDKHVDICKVAASQ
jgi:hypothetical protein